MAVALLPQFSHLVTLGIGSALDLLTNLLADAVAFGLQRAAFLFEVPLLLSDQLEACEINGLAPTPQFPGDRIGIVTHKALVEHGSGGNSAGSLWQADQSTWPTMTAATAEKSVMPRAVRGFCPCATATVVITPAPRQATAAGW